MDNERNHSNNFKWNYNYIATHKLPEETLEKSRIEKINPEEIFVRHPVYWSYFVSQFGRVISMKCGKVRLLEAYIGGQPDRQYLYYGFCRGSEKHTVGMHRAVADVFCPNFWDKSVRLDAHHIDGNKFNNDYRNLILLPTRLHAVFHTINIMVLLIDCVITQYNNPLDLLEETGLTLEEILLANKGKKKPLKSTGGYTVFDIKGNLIGFQYYPQKRKQIKKEKNNYDR